MTAPVTRFTVPGGAAGHVPYTIPLYGMSMLFHHRPPILVQHFAYAFIFCATVRLRLNHAVFSG
jgi:hypothetical protein